MYWFLFLLWLVIAFFCERFALLWLSLLDFVVTLFLLKVFFVEDLDDDLEGMDCAVEVANSGG
jgi:hypothetical protein